MPVAASLTSMQDRAQQIKPKESFEQMAWAPISPADARAGNP